MQYIDRTEPFQFRTVVYAVSIVALMAVITYFASESALFGDSTPIAEGWNPDFLG